MGVFLIKNGEIYDPEIQKWEKRDLVVKEGKIVSGAVLDKESGGLNGLGAGNAPDSCQVIDATGCMVTTGWIDYHVHYFNHGTENGINPDAASFPCGVTTAVDGGSCGAGNYEMYQKSVMAHSDVRILNMLLMGSGGQTTDRYQEHLEAKYFDLPKIRRLFEKYPDNLVGLKSRMSVGIIAPEDAEESIRTTVNLAEELGCNVAVHITNPVMDLEKLAGILRKDDVICHIYQGKGRETCLDSDGRVRKGLLEARERGVLFDASNGCNNFDIEVGRQAVEQGFKPDIISSDINTSGFFLQPLHSLPRIMSKYLEWGMSLEEILDSVTRTPARLIHREKLASLREGTTADLVIFKVKEKDVPYYDRAGHSFIGHRVIVPQLTMKDGVIMYCQADFM